MSIKAVQQSNVFQKIKLANPFKNLKLSVVALSIGLMSFSTATNLQATAIKVATSPAISWQSESLDVGNIPQGTPKTMVFTFKNDSKTAIEVTSVQASCGCTATDYTKTKIEPGKTGTVSVTYNAANKGGFAKTVSVTTTAETTTKILTFKGTVI